MPVAMAYCIIAHINQSLIIPQRLRVVLHGAELHLADPRVDTSRSEFHPWFQYAGSRIWLAPCLSLWSESAPDFSVIGRSRPSIQIEKATFVCLLFKFASGGANEVACVYKSIVVSHFCRIPLGNRHSHREMSYGHTHSPFPLRRGFEYWYIGSGFI
jgi:hypothetical protein